MSDMPHQERLVRRVRKLLELSRNNSNAHEAGLALARAQQLMAKHGITEQDAGLSSVQTSSSQGHLLRLKKFRRGCFVWSWWCHRRLAAGRITTGG